MSNLHRLLSLKGLRSLGNSVLATAQTPVSNLPKTTKATGTLAGLRSLGNSALATAKTPVSNLSKTTKATGALAGLGLGSAIGHEIGQPLLEYLKHSNPEGFLSTAEVIARRADLEAGARAANLLKAKEFLHDALASADKLKNSTFIDSEISRAVNANKERAAESLRNYLQQRGGDTLFPRAAELSGILAQARASEVLQDAAKALPIAGPAADVSELVRNLTIVNSLSNPEIISSIKSSYKPILDNILPKSQQVLDSAASSIGSSAKSNVLGNYESFLNKIRSAPTSNISEIRESLVKVQDPRATISGLVGSNKDIPTAMQKALDSANKRVDYGVIQADRSISPSIDLLRSNSPGIPVPKSLSLDSASALSAANSALKQALIEPAAEMTAKVIGKAVGKQVPGFGWTYGLIDSGGSMGRKAVFDKYISGAFSKPGGNYLVDSYYYTPNANTLYNNLSQSGGAVEKLYNKSLDTQAISRMGRSVLPKSLHEFLPRSSS